MPDGSFSGAPQGAFLSAFARTKAVMDAARARHGDGRIDLAAVRDLVGRVSRVKARARHLRARRVGGPHPEAVALAQLDRLSAALAAGGTVRALDVGSNPSCVFDEVGLSTWRAGRIETVTYVVEGASYRYPDPADRVLRHPLQVYRPSLHGPTEVLPEAEIKARVRDAADAADVLAFHCVGADAHKIGLRYDPARLFDTERVGRIRSESCPALAMLCDLHGVDVAGHHNSGNDAWMTLSLALAMARDDTGDLLRERLALRMRRDALKHRLVMLPSRGPWPRDMVSEWEAACDALQRHRPGPPTPVPDRVAGLLASA